MMMIRYFAIALLALLPACQLMQPTSDMSAAQITAAVKDKNASVICSTIRGVWGSAELITITLDQNSIKDGGISADNKGGCNANITSAAPPRPVPVVVTPTGSGTIVPAAPK